MTQDDKISRLFARSVSKHQTLKHEYHAKATYEDIMTFGLPWLELDIDIPYQLIEKEINAVNGLIVPHRTQYNANSGWGSFCIHGKSFDTTQHSLNDPRPFIWTPEAEEHMPITVNFFKNVWPCSDYDRLRVMLLEPGASIEVHKDRDISLLNEVNIAITQPNNCNFYMEHHGIIPFTVGKAFILDISNRHCVINDSDENRYHIIIHQNEISQDFKKLVEKSYHRVYNNIIT